MSQASSNPCTPPGIELITGPTMVGIVLNWMFLGVLIPQTYYYNLHFPRDPIKIKILVYCLVFLDIVQSVMILADAFHWFVFGYGNTDRLDEAFLNAWDVPFLDAVIAVIVQAFYCWRIWVLRRSYILPGVILLVSLAGFGAGFRVAVHAQQLRVLSRIGENIKEQTTWLICSALADVLITAALSWTLLRSRSKELPSNQRMIASIVRATVETNCLTAGVAILALALYLGIPEHTTFVVPPTAIIGKLYTNCLIAVLNNRVPQQYSSGFRLNSSGTSGSSYAHSHTVDVSAISTNTPSGTMKVEVLHSEHCDEGNIELDSLPQAKQPSLQV